MSSQGPHAQADFAGYLGLSKGYEVAVAYTHPGPCPGPEAQICPLRQESGKHRGPHLHVPEVFHIRVDINQLIDLFHRCLGGGMQGHNHKVLDN